METEAFIIFGICLLISVAMLTFWRWKTRGGEVGNLWRQRRIRRYNTVMRPRLKVQFPDHYVASLLPAGFGEKGDALFYTTWTNFVPVLLPLADLTGVVLLHHDTRSGAIVLHGVITPDELRATIGADIHSENRVFPGSVRIDEVAEPSRVKLIACGKDRALPAALEALSALKQFIKPTTV